MKVVSQNQVDFNATLGTVAFGSYSNFDIRNVYAIINVTSNVILYATGTSKGGAYNSNNKTLTLSTSTNAMQNSDILTVIYEQLGPVNTSNSQSVVLANDHDIIRTGNVVQKMNDNFTNLSNWDIQTANDDLITIDGNSGGSSYLMITKSTSNVNTETILTSKNAIILPLRFMFGVTLSNRINGQECSVEIIEVDKISSLPKNGLDASDTPIAIVDSSIVFTSGVSATITLASTHSFVVGHRVSIYGAFDSRLNTTLSTVSAIISSTQIQVTSSPSIGTITVTATQAPYTAMIMRSRTLGDAEAGAGFLYDSTTVTNAIYSIQNPSISPLVSSATNFGTNYTLANTVSTAAFTYNFFPRFTSEISLAEDFVHFVSYAIDSTGGINTVGKRTQDILEPSGYYKIRIRAKNTISMSVVVGTRIISAVKTGTTTATITTASEHGLSTGSYIQIYGIRDQTNFANLTTATVVATVVDNTSFTIAFGTAVSATSQGGVVFLVNGTNGGTFCGNAIASLSCVTNGLLRVTGTANWTNVSVGEYVQLIGLEGTGIPYEGRYKTGSISTTILDLVAPNITVAGFGSLITTGGAVLKCTDFRIHFIRTMMYNRNMVEIVGGYQRGDSQISVPVTFPTTQSVNAFITGVTTTGTGTAVTSVKPFDGEVGEITSGIDATGTGGTRGVFGVTMQTDKPGYLVIDQSTDQQTYVEASQKLLQSSPIPRYLITAAATNNANVATYTTSTRHYFDIGQGVYITGLLPHYLNGYRPVLGFTTGAASTNYLTFTCSVDNNSATLSAATVPIVSATRTTNVTRFGLRNATISTIAVSSANVYTVTTTANHGFVAYDVVSFSNITNPTFTNLNGKDVQLLTGATTSMTFYSYNSNTAVTSTSVTGTVYMMNTLNVGSLIKITGFTDTTYNTAGTTLFIPITAKINDYTFDHVNPGTNGTVASGFGSIQAYGTAIPIASYIATLDARLYARYARIKYVNSNTPKIFAISAIEKPARFNALLYTASAHTFIPGDTVYLNINATTANVAAGYYVVQSIINDVVTSIFYVEILHSGATNAKTNVQGTLLSSCSVCGVLYNSYVS